jgi:glycosyltransferase involved in cell wall biosynthesis
VSVKRLAMISAVSPYPTDAGKKVVLAGLIDYFVARLSAEHVHYLLIGNEPDGEFPVPMVPISGPSAGQAIRNTAVRSALGRSSLQESFLWSRRTQEALTRCLDEIGADVELYDTVRTAQYAGGGPGPTRICYLDDLFSERYATMLTAGKADRTVNFRPLGNFAERVPARLHFLTENRTTQRALLLAEQRLIARSENRATQSFDRCLLINEHETSVLRRRAKVADERVETIPPLVKAPAEVGRDYRGAPEFLFLGLLSLPHNDDGLRTFIRGTWPAVLRRMPDARLRVVGREPQPELHEAIAQYGGGAISLEGYVPDLGELMASSAAMLNPVRLGSGVKLKIIESLARALPVLSSGIGADGVLAGAEHGVCVAKGADDWVDQLEQLTSPEYNSQVSDAAAAHFSRIYSRSAVFAAYDHLFGLG